MTRSMTNEYNTLTDARQEGQYLTPIEINIKIEDELREATGKNGIERLANSAIPGYGALDFTLPAELAATEPPEARGLARDEVRLLVSYQSDDRILHTQFRDIARFLAPGDVVVVNTSGTLNAALPAARQDGSPLELHLSTRLPANLWIVEVRQPAPDGKATLPFYTAKEGEILDLPAGGRVKLLVPYRSEGELYAREEPGETKVRLWVATLEIPAQTPFLAYLNEYGFPIRYSYIEKSWPLSYYQTVYVTEMGSAEMPSAGRAFTIELLNQLTAGGVKILPLLLHTGVASLEDHEPPYEEYYRVPRETARGVNEAHAAGKRVIAVGTTVVRALETVTDETGVTHPGEGLTRLIITPERGLRAVSGLLTGFHEPRATHLAMLEALAGVDHLKATYPVALAERYLWHEFGDLHLILP